MAAGAVFTLWPFIDQMNPDASALALASTEVDISAIQQGQSITVFSIRARVPTWRKASTAARILISGA